MEKIVLGIDPGTNVMGYGVLRVDERHPSLVVMGVLQLQKFESHYLRLKRIYERVLGLIDQYHPDELAIESPFVGINPNSMIKLCRAQGVAMAAAVERDIPIFEYPPAKVKIQIVGNGSASKEQVAAMVKNILHLTDEDMNSKNDASDAIAIALTHFYMTSKPEGLLGRKGSNPKIPRSSGSGSSSWSEFVAKNSERVHK
ncbi:MAG: crossover junction endodeoxyribonuclease RuvC [Bacteroidales bacterium]|nr:crossover junction endodeoxyribonuclease RuvC [Bacteroidales bacterium]MBP5681410.1 crossover junction endodeoxyribonuclease RuvC [Bacteroidales bacterium]